MEDLDILFLNFKITDCHHHLHIRVLHIRQVLNQSDNLDEGVFQINLHFFTQNTLLTKALKY